MLNFDKDRSGKISIEEFFRGLQGDMKRKRKLIVRKAYDMLDKDGSGEVTVNDIRGAYDCSEHEKVLSGEWTEYEALEEILATYEQGEGERGGRGAKRSEAQSPHFRELNQHPYSISRRNRYLPRISGILSGPVRGDGER